MSPRITTLSPVACQSRSVLAPGQLLLLIEMQRPITIMDHQITWSQKHMHLLIISTIDMDFHREYIIKGRQVIQGYLMLVIWAPSKIQSRRSKTNLLSTIITCKRHPIFRVDSLLVKISIQEFKSLHLTNALPLNHYHNQLLRGIQDKKFMKLNPSCASRLKDRRVIKIIRWLFEK